MLSVNRMLGSFCVSTTRKYRFASVRPSMHRDIVNHSPDTPAQARERELSVLAASSEGNHLRARQLTCLFTHAVRRAARPLSRACGGGLGWGLYRCPLRSVITSASPLSGFNGSRW